ncbi:MAG: protein kinase [Chitinivibrionales bacterium]|nr:protein kinase [Chitinivibrionales bacterium]
MHADALDARGGQYHISNRAQSDYQNVHREFCRENVCILLKQVHYLFSHKSSKRGMLMSQMVPPNPQPNQNIKVDKQQENPYQYTIPRIGDMVGPNKLQVSIGEGGAAHVFKVWHTGLEVIRALKILKKGNNQEARDRFLTEAKILADIHHPNIVEIHGIGSWQKQAPYLEMEFIDGLPIRKIISQNGRLPIPAALAMAYFVCQGLHYAHTKDYTLYGKVYKGLIHRDIKPENIFVSRDGIVKLMDFGIARPSDISLHTVGDKIMGTLVYLSPEQLSGKDLDHRTDTFSLGCVLYEMITGKRAFPQQKLSELIQFKTKGKFQPVDSFEVQIPKCVKEVVEKAMAQDPAQRYNTAADFGHALFLALRELVDMSPQDIISNYMRNPLSIANLKKPKSESLAPVIFITATTTTAIIAGIFALLKFVIW